jgi:hypothetical protein
VKSDEIIKEIDRVLAAAYEVGSDGYVEAYSVLIDAKELIRLIADKDSHFASSLLLQGVSYGNVGDVVNIVVATLKALKNHVNANLFRTISVRREVEIDTVSDYLIQAQKLLNDDAVHPAVPAVIIGASLEEFLRNWLQDVGFDLTTIKNTLDPYAQELRKMNLISVQDMKEITGWGGIRNDAAHGHWDKVSSHEKVSIMLQGVNLFMRKYSS